MYFHPTKIMPFGFVDLDAPDVAKQVTELHEMGYRGLGELEFVKEVIQRPVLFSSIRVGESLRLDRPVPYGYPVAEEF
jgi:hypothetical protein